MENIANLMKRRWYFDLLALLILWQAIAMIVGSRDYQHRVFLEDSGVQVTRGSSHAPICFVSCLSDELGAVEIVLFKDRIVTSSDSKSLRHLSCCKQVWFDNCTFDDVESAIGDLSQLPSLEDLSLTNLSNADVLLGLMVDHQVKVDSLALRQVTLSDAAIDHLARIPRLRILWLSGVKMPENGKRRLEKLSPHLIIQQSK